MLVAVKDRDIQIARVDDFDIVAVGGPVKPPLPDRSRKRTISSFWPLR